ncbi:hypothetical protein [Thermoleptolyngbya sp.]
MQDSPCAFKHSNTLLRYLLSPVGIALVAFFANYCSVDAIAVVVVLVSLYA